MKATNLEKASKLMERLETIDTLLGRMRTSYGSIIIAFEHSDLGESRKSIFDEKRLRVDDSRAIDILVMERHIVQNELEELGIEL